MSRTHLSSKELIELGAVDRAFYNSTFFPRAHRMAMPKFHEDMWDMLESSSRLVNLQVFRGGAKTTIARTYTAKRIAYGFSRTVLYIGKSETHAARSIQWIRNQVQFNPAWANTFQLTRGEKWTDLECQIIHKLRGHTIHILALGITGSVRGVNIEDYRPDLIVVDDVIDEENSATPDQRKKTNDLIYGALKESLAPATESPDAKMVMLQTPLNREDASTLALSDPEWLSARFGIWTEDTEDAPLAQQISRWEERYPSETVRQEKRFATERNQLSVFLREKECKIVSSETSAFRPTWLKHYELAPEHMQVVLSIDPVPPPSEIQIAKGLRGKDFEALAVVGRHGGDFYLLDYSMRRGHEPNWTVSEFFTLALRWRPKRTLVEAVAYQRTLAWLLRKAMDAQRIYFVIQEVVDRRKKFDRIVDALSGPAANGHLYVKPEHVEFISQFSAYPDVAHDDLLDAVATAMSELQNPGYAGADDDMYEDLVAAEKDIPKLEYRRGAP